MFGGGMLPCARHSPCLHCHPVCQRSTARPRAASRCHLGYRLAETPEQAARSSTSFIKDWISASGSVPTRSPRTSSGCALNCTIFHSPFEISFDTLQSLRSSSRSWMHLWNAWSSRYISSSFNQCKLGSEQRPSPVVLAIRWHPKRGAPSDSEWLTRRSRRS